MVDGCARPGTLDDDRHRVISGRSRPLSSRCPDSRCGPPWASRSPSSVGGGSRWTAARRVARLVRDWHPLVLFPFLFKEVEPLAAAIGDGDWRSTIPALEARLFAGQPSLYLSQRLALMPLSEFLPLLLSRMSRSRDRRILVRDRAASGIRRVDACCQSRCWKLPLLHPASGRQPVAPPVSAARPRWSTTSSSTSCTTSRHAAGPGWRVSQRAHVQARS